MAHAEGWVEAYEALEEGRPISGDLLSTVDREWMCKLISDFNYSDKSKPFYQNPE